jgi:hypothetical protein
MLSDAGSVGGLSRRVAFLFLALSVFWFGLHARSKAYKSPSSTRSDSKMSTPMRSADVLTSIDRHVSPTDPVGALLIRLFFSRFHSDAIQLPFSQIARFELADPRRLDSLPGGGRDYAQSQRR